MRVVWPTSRGWAVLLIASMWFVVASVHGEPFALLFACAAMALCAASLVCACLSLRGLAVERGPVGDAATGRAVAMPLMVRNGLRRRRQPIVVLEKCQFCPTHMHSVVVDPLSPREERTVQRHVLALHRGEFELDRLLLRSGDPAGLFFRQRVYRCPKRVLVVPGTEPIPDLQLRQEHSVPTAAGTPLSAAGMGQDIYGVREYHPSDGLRYIHWKSSARFGKLMVREFERNAVMSVAVFLDAYEHSCSGVGHWSNLEYQIRAAASVCNHLAALYCTLTFGAGGSRPIVIPSRPAADVQQEILHSLATLKPGRTTLSDIILETARGMPRNSVVFCLSLGTPKSLSKALEILTQGGMTVRWFCARRESFAGSRKARRQARKELPAQSPLVAVEEVHPGMRLARVLSGLS